MSGRKRTERLAFRLRPWERRVLETAAERRGVYVSELVRGAALVEARRALRGDGREPETGDDAGGAGPA